MDIDEKMCYLKWRFLDENRVNRLNGHELMKKKNNKFLYLYRISMIDEITFLGSEA